MSQKVAVIVKQENAESQKRENQRNVESLVRKSIVKEGVPDVAEGNYRKNG